MIQEINAYKNVERHESLNKARIVDKPSIASASSFQFGNEQMIKAQKGLLERVERQSLEDICFIADGEDTYLFRHLERHSVPLPNYEDRTE